MLSLYQGTQLSLSRVSSLCSPKPKHLSTPIIPSGQLVGVVFLHYAFSLVVIYSEYLMTVSLGVTVISEYPFAFQLCRILTPPQTNEITVTICLSETMSQTIVKLEKCTNVVSNQQPGAKTCPKVPTYASS